MNRQEFEAYRKKTLGPAERAARELFSSPSGKLVLDTLDRVFARNLVARDGAGRVDDAGTLVRVGNKEVIEYLRDLAAGNEGGQG